MKESIGFLLTWCDWPNPLSQEAGRQDVASKRPEESRPPIRPRSGKPCGRDPGSSRSGRRSLTHRKMLGDTCMFCKNPKLRTLFLPQVKPGEPKETQRGLQPQPKICSLAKTPRAPRKVDDGRQRTGDGSPLNLCVLGVLARDIIPCLSMTCIPGPPLAGRCLADYRLPTTASCPETPKRLTAKYPQDQRRRLHERKNLLQSSKRQQLNLCANAESLWCVSPMN